MLSQSLRGATHDLLARPGAPAMTVLPPSQPALLLPPLSFDARASASLNDRPERRGLATLVDREGLLGYLRALGNPFWRAVNWNREPIPLSEATARAERLPRGARAAVSDDGVFTRFAR